MERKLVELLILEDGNYGVDAVSLVKHPAIESNWIYMSKDDRKQFISLAMIDEEKRTIIGAALIPDKHIPRYDESSDEEYDVYFSAETVLRASELFLENNYAKSATLEHEENIEGVSVVESWIVSDPDNDKSRVFGLDVPIGTWMIRARIDSDEVWESVKSGEYRGFSIEGFFADSIQKMKAEPKLSLESMVRKLYNKLVKRNFYVEAKLNDGSVIASESDEFAAGVEVYKIGVEGLPVEIDNGQYETSGGVKFEVFNNVLIEYDGEVEAVEEKEAEAGETPVEVDLSGMRVKYYTHLMRNKYAKKLGKVELSRILEKNKYTMRSDKKGFMRDLERMGLKVGDFSWGSSDFYAEGGFDISAEDGEAYKYIDYYGEFRGGYPYIAEAIEEMAEDYGYILEWYNAGVLQAAPQY
tara:strand:+ start:8824 stop:10059 length:1236 start_codon:yes stop_codon:yes gene_type:complete